MHVLITGASGFIGSHLSRALVKAGHKVTAAVRNPRALNHFSSDIRVVSIDFSRPPRPEHWLEHLKGIDAVINAVGIIRETNQQRFQTLHEQAPIALFQACEQARVRRVVQISALGADDQAQSQYHLSKKAADDFLATSSLEWIILRPSIVYGPGARSMALFKALAALPVTPLVNRGEQLIQPIHVADLTRVVLHCLSPNGPTRDRIDLVGPQPISFNHLMRRLRNWLGMRPPRLIHIPYEVSLAMAKLGGFLGNAPITSDSVRMLQRGNTGRVEDLTHHFNFIPRTLDDALSEEPARETDQWHAGLYFLRPLLRCCIALVWISAGVVSAFIYPQADSYALLSQVGLSGSWAALALYGAAGLDLLLGLATLSNRWLHIAAYGQLLTMAAYTLIITLFLPSLWAHPFGPVVKNLPLVIATMAMLVLERRPSWNI